MTNPQPVAPAGQADDWCVKCHVHGHQAANCEAPAGQAAAGVQGEKPNRNDPVSALAIRVIVAKGYCTQEQANECFSLACDALEAEAARMNEELPWVTRVPSPAVERGVAEERMPLHVIVHALKQLCQMARTTGGTAGPDMGLMAACENAESILQALSTAGKEQA